MDLKIATTVIPPVWTSLAELRDQRSFHYIAMPATPKADPCVLVASSEELYVCLVLKIGNDFNHHFHVLRNHLNVSIIHSS
jgi:hypothetical protein